MTTASTAQQSSRDATTVVGRCCFLAGIFRKAQKVVAAREDERLTCSLILTKASCTSMALKPYKVLVILTQLA